MEDPDYYGVLGVLPSATWADIKRAFRTAAKRCHPDAGGSEAQMIALLNAYEVLGDPRLRSAYNEWRAGRSPLPVVAPRPTGTDWRSHVGSAESFSAWVNAQTGSVESVWQKVGRYTALLRKGITLEWAALKAVCAEGEAEQALAQHVKQYGRISIEQAMSFEDAVLDQLCQHGIRLEREIRDRREEIEAAEAELKGLNEASAAAKKARENLEQFKRLNKRAGARLAGVEAKLGPMVRSRVEHAPAFASLLQTCREAETKVEEARAAAKSVRSERQEVDRELGVPFRVAALFATAAAVTLGLWLLPIGSMTSTAIGWVVGQDDRVVLITSRTAGQKHGLSRDQLALAAEVVETRWTTWRPGSKGLFGWTPMPDVNGGCSGSAGVVSVSTNGEMTLITNRHVLDLEKIMASKANGDLSLTDYVLRLNFPAA